MKGRKRSLSGDATVDVVHGFGGLGFGDVVGVGRQVGG